MVDPICTMSGTGCDMSKAPRSELSVERPIAVISHMASVRAWEGCEQGCEQGG